MKYLVFALSISGFLFGYNEVHVNTLLQQVESGDVLNASGCDFRGAGTLLQGVKIPSGSILSGANFGICKSSKSQTGCVCIPNQVTDLTEVVFKDVELVSVNFEKAMLKKANFSGANLMNANFSNADLRGANFKGAQNIDLAVFCGATMPDGTRCTSKTWKSRSKTMFYCHCPQQS